MFHPEDLGGITRLRLITRFFPALDYLEDAADSGNTGKYSITINSTKQFNLVAQYLFAGLSLYKMTQVVVNTKERCQPLCSFHLCNETAVHCGDFAKVLIILCRARNIKHMVTTYWDVCIRICHKSTVHEFHLLSIPVHDRHTGEIIFKSYPRQWKLYTWTGARILLESIWMTIRRW